MKPLDAIHEDYGGSDDADLENGSASMLSFDSNFSDEHIDENDNNKDDDDDSFAVNESQAVCWLRGIVICVMFLAMVLSAIGVFLALQRAEEREFEVQVESNAMRLLDNFNSKIEETAGALESMAVGITSYTVKQQANAINDVWPFVTIPDFPSRAAATSKLVDGISINMLPLITSESTRLLWEQYSTLHGKEWINEGIQFDSGTSTTSKGYGSTFVFTNEADSATNNNNTQSSTTQDKASSSDNNNNNNNEETVIDLQIPHQQTRQKVTSQGNDNNNRQLQQPQIQIPDFTTHGYSTKIFTLFPTIINGTNTDLPIVQPPFANPNSVLYMPIWQSSPVVRQLPNYNIHTSDQFQDGLQAVFDSELAVLGRVANLDRGNAVAAAVLAVWEKHDDIHAGDPFSVLFFPIFNSFQADRELVGIITLVKYWHTYINNVLPPSIQGMIVVVENACGQAFSWVVDGHRVQYLGDTDQHDTTYDYLEFNDHISFTPEVGVPLNQNFCPYTIKVYPSTTTRDLIVTRRPQLYAMFVVVLFVSTFMVFSVYDWIVEQRQRVVLKSALENRAIVSSLFPSAVRERLYQEESNNNNDSLMYNTVEQAPDTASVTNKSTTSSRRLKQNYCGDDDDGDNDDDRSIPKKPRSKKKKISNKVMKGTKSAMVSIVDPSKQSTNSDARGTSDKTNNGFGLNESNHSSSQNGTSIATPNPSSDIIVSAKPIADLFPDCTVFFADIAGFTAWSSKREPTHVFTLLQTLYQNFDRYAKRLNVFKVETIGDCYLAVTGLPEPQDDHAVRMARFARECLFRMKDLTTFLQPTLGLDTANLHLRVGLHSGPVTAGVLRGEKSRFQLFGDTVNTAARMESTGKPAKIQCSRDTADLLREGQKGYWLSEREDVVVAKGKGEMKTFWIANRTTGGTSSNSRPLTSVSDHGRRSTRKDTMLPTTSGHSRRGKRRRKKKLKNAIVEGADSELDDSNSTSPMIISSEHGKRPSSSLRRKSTKRSSGGENSIILETADKTEDTTSSSSNADDAIKTKNSKNQKRRVSHASQEIIAHLKRESAIADASIDGVEISDDEYYGFLDSDNEGGGGGDTGAPGYETDDTVSSESVMLKGEDEFRLIEWHVDLFSQILLQVMNAQDPNIEPQDIAASSTRKDLELLFEPTNCIEFPSPAPQSYNTHDKLPTNVKAQLQEFTTTIAMKYRKLAFHSLDRATHVTMAMAKFLTNLNENMNDNDNDGSDEEENFVHYISKNPLVCFAMVVASFAYHVNYNRKNRTAEDSVQMIWDVLHLHHYKALRTAIFPTQKDYDLFRQVLVNVIMATDIDHPSKSIELVEQEEHDRKERYKRAFAGSLSRRKLCQDLDENRIHLRATVMLEYTMQACHMIHAMQHWILYHKWNEAHFEEEASDFENVQGSQHGRKKEQRRSSTASNYSASLSLSGHNNRQEDPTLIWYSREQTMFEMFVIPVAERLNETNMFDEKLSQQCLNYATQNSHEWILKGQQIVSDFAKTMEKNLIPSGSQSVTKLHHASFGGNASFFDFSASDGSLCSFSSFGGDGNDDSDLEQSDVESYSGIEDNNSRGTRGSRSKRSKRKKGNSNSSLLDDKDLGESKKG